MEKFTIRVKRISYASKDIEVTASSLAEAQLKALSEAGDHEYSEDTAEYELDDVALDQDSLFPEDEIDYDTVSKFAHITQVRFESTEDYKEVMMDLRKNLTLGKITLDQVHEMYEDDETFDE